MISIHSTTYSIAIGRACRRRANSKRNIKIIINEKEYSVQIKPFCCYHGSATCDKFIDLKEMLARPVNDDFSLLGISYTLQYELFNFYCNWRINYAINLDE